MKKNQPKEQIDHEITENMVCPYYGYEHESYDCLEWCDNSGETECDDCGKTFTYTRDFTVTFSTQRKRLLGAKPGESIKVSTVNLEEVYEFLGIKRGTSFNDNQGFGIDYDNDKKLKITTSYGPEIVRPGDTILCCSDTGFEVVPMEKE